MSNEISPELGSICINLNTHPQSVSAGRKYMVGNMIPKSCRVKGLTPRRIATGFESEYGKYCRRIESQCNMMVELVSYRRTLNTNEHKPDDWGELDVIYFNCDTNEYSLLKLPRYHTQNYYVAYEYIYDKQMLNRLKKGETFSKGEVFAVSPGVADTGEWMVGLETYVAGMTLPGTEEDGIIATRSYLERLGVMFEHVRNFSWNDSEYVPVLLYGTDDDPKPFPENGERIRDDGLVMAFRRRDSNSALVSLTKKALRTPDLIYDIKFYAPPGSIVKGIEIKSERYKDRSNNSKAEKPSYQHTKLLERYELEDNARWNEVKRWYYNLASRYEKDQDLPISKELWGFIYQAFGNVTKDHATNKFNFTKRTHRNKQLLDWNIKITLKEEVRGKIRFKLSCMNGGKGVIVSVIEDCDAPVDKYGRRAELIVNNTPAFRRQIYSTLMEASINFINVNVYDKVVLLRNEGKYKEAMDYLLSFYETTSPEFHELVEGIVTTDTDFTFEHIDYIAKQSMICIQRRPDSKVVGVKLIKNLKEKFGDYKPTTVIYTNELGEREETLEPVMIAPLHYMLLDKFGTDLSCESFPKRNLFGLPAPLNQNDKYNKPYRAKVDRNTGETEARIAISQDGGEETARMLALANSPEAARMAIKRIIRSENPFLVPHVILPTECASNRALQLGINILHDSGYALRGENENDFY